MIFYYCPGDNCMYLVPTCPVHWVSLEERSLADYVRANTYSDKKAKR